MWAAGRSVWTTILGLRGSDTSTAVKFFGALSCASHRMRRPSGAIWIDMPSPMPPNPSSMWWAISLKFQVMGPPLLFGVLVLDVPTAPAFGTDFLAAFFAAAFFAGRLTAAFLPVFFAALRPRAFIAVSMLR